MKNEEQRKFAALLNSSFEIRTSNFSSSGRGPSPGASRHPLPRERAHELMTATPDLSVVFPVYNEEENVPILLDEIAAALAFSDHLVRPRLPAQCRRVPILLDEIAAALRGQPWSYEMVAVDDGSGDRSLEI